MCSHDGLLVPYIYANCFADFTLMEFCFILRKFGCGSWYLTKSDLPRILPHSAKWRVCYELQ